VATQNEAARNLRAPSAALEHFQTVDAVASGEDYAPRRTWRLLSPLGELTNEVANLPLVESARF